MTALFYQRWDTDTLYLYYNHCWTVFVTTLRAKCTVYRPTQYAEFLPCDAMHARYYPWDCVRRVCLSVCLCLCLSQVGVPLKRLNTGLHKQNHTIAQGL